MTARTYYELTVEDELENPVSGLSLAYEDDKLIGLSDGSVTIPYDSIGNPTQYTDFVNAPSQLQWQGRQLAGAAAHLNMFGQPTPGTASYEYDSNGLRTHKTVEFGMMGSEEMQVDYEYIWEGTLLLGYNMCMEEGNSVAMRIIYGDDGESLGYTYKDANGEGDTIWYIKNMFGDTQGLYSASKRQMEVIYTYDAWGTPTMETANQTDPLSGLYLLMYLLTNQLTYRGYYYDFETGLYYLQSRYYAPSWGRFLNADKHFDTGAGALGTNRYVYCNNNPVMFTDYTGEGGVVNKDKTSIPKEFAVEVSETEKIKATVVMRLPGTPKMSWSSSDKSIVDIVGSGKNATILGNKTGVATITFKANTVEKKCKVYVFRGYSIHKDSNNSNLNYEHLWMGSDYSKKIYAKTDLESANNLQVEWSVDYSTSRGKGGSTQSKATNRVAIGWTNSASTGGSITVKCKVNPNIKTKIPLTVISRLPAQLAFLKIAQKMRLQQPSVTDSSTSVYKGAALTVQGQVGNYYYTTFGSKWGFFPKTDINMQNKTFNQNIKSHNMYNHRKSLVLGITSLQTKFDSELDRVRRTYKDNKTRYEKIAKAAGVPPELVVAIHYRECDLKFDRYLHNGDTLGSPTVHVPSGVFFQKNEFDAAAIHALTWQSYRNDVKRDLGISTTSRDILAMMIFAEYYNGTGCYDKQDKPINPYLFCGTNIYKKGGYASDGNWSYDYISNQPGIYLLICSVY